MTINEPFPSTNDGGGSPAFLSRWEPDRWLPGYQQCTAYFMETDDEGQVIATFVRKDPQTLLPGAQWRRFKRKAIWRNPAAILYIHGWNDHFYRRHASEFWESMGVRFYAVDLPKFGRSYRHGQTPGYTEDLHSYFPVLDALRDQIVRECGPHVRILVIGHSMGGLIASLWMHHRRPHHVTALMLNSPWLELQLTRFGRWLTTPVVRGVTMMGGKTAMPLNDPGFYSRTLYKSRGGLWHYERYQLPESIQFQPRAGWMNAIYNGQDEVAKGLDIQVPVLVCTSEKSLIQTRWDPQMARADTVLDVQSVRKAAVNLGHVVTLVSIPGALHDISMSAPDARREYFRVGLEWASQWAWGDSHVDRRAERKALDAVCAADGNEGWDAEDGDGDGAAGNGGAGDSGGADAGDADGTHSGENAVDSGVTDSPARVDDSQATNSGVEGIKGVGDGDTLDSTAATDV